MSDESVSLREYLEKVMDLQFAAARDAVEKAFESKGLADVQVIAKIEALRERIESNLTKSEYEIRHQELVKKMENLWDFRSDVHGRETMVKVLWYVVIGIVGLAIGYLARR